MVCTFENQSILDCSIHTVLLAVPLWAGIATSLWLFICSHQRQVAFIASPCIFCRVSNPVAVCRKVQSKSPALFCFVPGLDGTYNYRGNLLPWTGIIRRWTYLDIIDFKANNFKEDQWVGFSHLLTVLVISNWRFCLLHHSISMQCERPCSSCVI